MSSNFTAFKEKSSVLTLTNINRGGGGGGEGAAGSITKSGSAS